MAPLHRKETHRVRTILLGLAGGLAFFILEAFHALSYAALILALLVLIEVEHGRRRAEPVPAPSTRRKIPHSDGRHSRT